MVEVPKRRVPILGVTACPCRVRLERGRELERGGEHHTGEEWPGPTEPRSHWGPTWLSDTFSACISLEVPRLRPLPLSLWSALPCAHAVAPAGGLGLGDPWCPWLCWVDGRVLAAPLGTVSSGCRLALLWHSEAVAVCAHRRGGSGACGQLLGPSAGGEPRVSPASAAISASGASWGGACALLVVPLSRVLLGGRDGNGQLCAVSVQQLALLDMEDAWN